jgi:hypothetical protein
MTLGLKKAIPFSLISLVLLFPGVLWGEDLVSKTNHVREQASVIYKSQHKVACYRELVEAALLNPLVMGALWASYGYKPSYRISGEKSLGADGSWPIHIEDPTGIVGNIWQIKAVNGRYTYLARGKLDHWAVPAFNEGTAVFDMEIISSGSTTQVKLDVFLMPESRFSEAVAWVLSPIIKARVENRVTLNLQDVSSILEDIAEEPEEVAKRLKQPLRKEFEQDF